MYTGPELEGLNTSAVIIIEATCSHNFADIWYNM